MICTSRRTAPSSSLHPARRSNSPFLNQIRRDVLVSSRPRIASTGWREIMLWYAWVFLVVAILAALLGFGCIAAASAGIAKICFVIFLVLFLVSLIAGRRRV